MKVYFVCHSGSRTLGGAERCTLEALDGLRALGVDCWAVVPAAGALHDELRRRGVLVEVVGYTWWMSDDRSARGRLKRLARNLLVTPRLAALMAARGCDVVYTSTVTVCSGALAARLLGLPHVWHLYEFGVEDHGLHFDLGFDRAARLIARLSDRCVAVSMAIRAHYAGAIPAEKLALVYFAVDEPPAAGPAPAAFGPGAGLKCVLAGRLQENKGQQDAVRAVARLNAAGVPATLLLAGRGDEPDEARLRALARETGVDGRVRFLGQVADAYGLMRAADAVLMCSRQEALGRVTVEAMYAGRPVVGARAGGTPELIEDGANGLLYEPGDDADLAAKLRALASDAGRARRLGEEGRRRALARFSRARLGAELLALMAPLGRRA